MVSLATRPRLCAVLEDVLGKDGGAGRNRTDDLYNAIVALSQLSYGPDLVWDGFTDVIKATRGGRTLGSSLITIKGKILDCKCQAVAPHSDHAC